MNYIVKISGTTFQEDIWYMDDRGLLNTRDKARIFKTYKQARMFAGSFCFRKPALTFLIESV